MAASLSINAQTREDLGRSSSRRLRGEGFIPGIVYGGEDDKPQPIKIRHDEMLHNLENEAFYASILQLKLEGNQEKVVLKAVQRHPAKINILHVDLQRVRSKSEISMHVPIHFLNADTAVGVKMGGEVDIQFSEVEIRCMAKDLPESLEVDIGNLDIGDSVTLSQINLPAGVSLTAFIGAEEEEIHDRDQMVAQITTARVSVEPDEAQAIVDEEGNLVESDADEASAKDTEE